MKPEVKNRILTSLPSQELDSFMRCAEFVHIDAKDMVIEPNKKIEIVDFVESGLHSILSVTDREEVEVATVGDEGMVGVPLVMGSDTTICKVFCEVPGTVWRLSASNFMGLLDTCPQLRTLCSRFAFSLFEQASQNSACNRIHAIEERCAKWLLLTQDRMHADEFELTQEFLAQMLGVRRASVNLAAGTLQNAGLIKYTRGKVKIRDRTGLLSVSCTCYKIIRKSLDSLSHRSH